MILRYFIGGGGAGSGGGGGSLAVTLDTYSIEDVVASPSNATGSCTATPSGGTAPYTYAWTKVGGTTSSVMVSGASTATVTFTLAISDLRSFVYKVTVTDANSTTITADVSVYLEVT